MRATYILFLFCAMIGSCHTDVHQTRRRPMREYPTSIADHDLQLHIDDVNKARALAVYQSTIKADHTSLLGHVWLSPVTKSEIIEAFGKHFDDMPQDKRTQTFAYLKEIEVGRFHTPSGPKSLDVQL